MTILKRRILFVALFILFFIVAIPVLFYAQGYRFGENFSFVKTGGIYVSSPQTGAEIFIDGDLKKETNLLQSGIFVQNLKAGNHSILVAKKGFWPWSKDLTVQPEKVAEARALMLPLKPEGEILIKGKLVFLDSSPSQNILLLIEKKSPALQQLNFYLPEEKIFLTPASGKSSNLAYFNDEINYVEWADGTASFSNEKGWFKATFNLQNNTFNIEQINKKGRPNIIEKFSARKLESILFNKETNEILARWLGDEKSLPYYFSEKEMPIFKGKDPVRNADFFPGRRDAAIVAISNGIFAIEFDGRDKRNFQPIYKGKDPAFAVFQNIKAVYVLDAGILTKIYLDF